MVAVFRKLGIPVTCPTEHTCCGQIAFNSGYRKAARVAARKFIGLFEGAEIIVCPSGSCAYMVKHHYLDLFRNDDKWLQRAQRVGAKTFELTEFLVDVFGIESIGASFNGKSPIMTPAIFFMVWVFMNNPEVDKEYKRPSICRNGKFRAMLWVWWCLFR